MEVEVRRGRREEGWKGEISRAVARVLGVGTVAVGG